MTDAGEAIRVLAEADSYSLRKNWRSHPWAKGREEMLERMSEDERRKWFARREEEDRIYAQWVAWTEGKADRP